MDVLPPRQARQSLLFQFINGVIRCSAIETFHIHVLPGGFTTIALHEQTFDLT